MERLSEETVEEIRKSLAAIATDQTTRLTAVTKRHDLAISNIGDDLSEVKHLLKGLQGGSSSRGPDGSSKGPRAIKVDLPRFSGEDPQGWLYQVEEYFAYHAIGEEAKIQIAALHMTKEVLAWIRGLRRNKLLSTWPKFVEDLTKRFGGSALDDKLEDLTRLQQTGSVAEYMTKFENLLNEVEGQIEEALITFFIGGLKTEIKSHLKIARPTTLWKALAMAKIYEANRGGRGEPWKNFSANIKTEPLIKTPSVGGPAVPFVRRTLTAEERKERTDKGLCFNYDEQFFPGHRCKEKLFRMSAEQGCLFEVIDIEPEPDPAAKETSGDMEISMHALSGSYNPRTIRMMGSVRGQQLSVLVDSGSTHNFIQGSVAHKLGIPLQELPEFRVFIGSGDYLICREVCRQVTVTIQEAVIVQDLFVLTMEGANVILGVQWLETLGVVRGSRLQAADYRV